MNDLRPTAVPVLCYHSISDDAHDGTLRWSVSPGDFDEQMALLKERQCTPLTVTRYATWLLGDLPMPERPVLVSLDDGYRDLATAALPVLLRYKLWATAYVVTGRIGAGRPELDWDQLAALRAGGVEIGSHSHTHRPLDCLGADELRAEVTGSRHVLEDGLGAAVDSFAYPFGYHGDRVRRAVLLAGYTSACAVKHALSHGGDDVYAIARVLVERDAGAAGIDALLRGEGRPLAWRGERLRTKGWRVWRRFRWALGPGS
ncbi:polysaccharide deacetylase family protein [Phytohabitans sp. LJ34]|uniref:polysaccharide deacetylase family protein n=1 Tax=Phytohabitans sp. LJ34 TaxID=3452217 RepID=UPI003F88BD29